MISTKADQILLAALANSLLTLLRYCCLNLNLPTVPYPTTPTRTPAQLAVMIKPIGKMPSVVPGISNLMTFPVTADVNAEVCGELRLELWPAKTPFTKDASFKDRLAVTVRFLGDVAEMVMSGITRSWSVIL